MSRPTFLLVGAAKAGTTSLYHYLHQHPDIFMSRVKEPHFFSWEDDGWPRWAVKTRAEYENLFDEGADATARGEASTWYLYSEGAADRIHAANPDMKIVALLRNPVERAYSNWSFNLEKGYDTALTFEEALALETERQETGTPWHQHYFQAGLYADQVRRYYERFGRERVLVLLYEDFRANPQRIVEQTYTFLGVEPTYTPDVTGVYNPTHFPKYKRLQRFIKTRNPFRKHLRQLLPARLHNALAHALRRVNQAERPPMAAETRATLRAAYHDNIMELEPLLGRDLRSVWL